MEFADFDAIDPVQIKELFLKYYPNQKDYTFRQKVLYLASEHSRLTQTECPELDDAQFGVYYTKDDETLILDCQSLLGVDCRNKITRLEAAYLCALYWSNALRLEVELTSETEEFLKSSLINSSKSTSHLEWISLVLLDSDTAAIGLKRLQKRDFGFKLEFERSSGSPGNQIRNKLHSVLTLNKIWPRSVVVKNVSFFIEDTSASFYLFSSETLTPLTRFLRFNPKKKNNLYKEMKSFIEAFDYSDLLGIETDLDKMKVNILGQIYIDDVVNIRTGHMPGFYKSVVLDNWNQKLISLGHDSISYKY